MCASDSGIEPEKGESMILYLAEGGYKYEQAHIVGLFSTEQLAKAWLATQRVQWSSVVPLKVDKPEWEEA